MRIVVNGKPVECEAGTNLRDLIVQLGFKPGAIVAERNREIVPGEQFAQTCLGEGDKLELLQFVGGG